MRLLLSIILIFGLSLTAFAQSIDKSAVMAVETRRAAIESFALQLESGKEIDLLAIREDLRNLRIEASSAARPLRDMRDFIKADIDRLGPVTDDKSEESENIANLRLALNEEFTRVDDAIRQSEINISRASRLLETVSEMRREAFYTHIFKRGITPFSKTPWTAARDSFGEGKDRLRASMKEVPIARSGSGANHNPVFTGLSFLFLLVMTIFGQIWLSRKLKPVWANLLPPKSGNRILRAGLKSLAIIVPFSISIVIAFEGLRALGFLPSNLGSLPKSVMYALLSLVLAYGLITSIFFQKEKDWNLVSLPEFAVSKVKALIFGAVGLLVLDSVLNAGANTLGAISELTELQSILVAVLGGVILFQLTSTSLWKQNGTDELAVKNGSPNWDLLRVSVKLLSVVAIFGALAGYGALGRFIVTRVFYLSAVFGIIWFFRNYIQELIQLLRRRSIAATNFISNKPKEEPLVFFWFGLLADIVLLVLSLPVLLIVMGMEPIEVKDCIKDAFNGFDVGPLTISLSQIIIAILTLTVILFLTRLVQGGLDKRVFAPAKFDDGIRNSFRTLLGYAGLVIAILAGLSVMGLKFANLAIVAGALSIGIGFGLQSIVNNFVSGLILLFERPIKVGDWVVVASGEGFVKNISVRSTEIETFDRASIIVPNSELISSSVKNWTHKDKYTRVIVPIGASYKEDPQAVMDILERCMGENKRVMSFPESAVFFAGFGASSLDFEMRVFIRSPDDRILVQNELRLAAFEAFKSSGIEIPYPQQDIYVRSLPEKLKDET